MDTSIFLAKLFGIYFLVVGVALLFRKEFMHRVYEDFFKSAGLMAMAGIVALFGGLLIILFHNVWVWGWPVVITIIGYLTFIKGITRLWFPDEGIAFFRKIFTDKGFNIIGIILLLVGIWLTLMGFQS